VTLDFWGTLMLDPPGSDDAAYRRRRLDAFEAILRGAGEAVPRTALDRGYQASGRFLADVWSDLRDVAVTEHVRAILAAAEAGLPARLPAAVTAALVDAYCTPALLVPPSVDPGARAALDALSRRGYALAVVSNTMRTPGLVLRRVLERMGLLPLFAHAVFSDEVGVRKPHARIFEDTLRVLAVEPVHAVHVGDDPVLDVEGSIAAGMRAIKVGPASPADRQAHAVIANLAQLPDAIARLDDSAAC
jgi:putative hydrolase of the HAD superfamily